METVKHDFTKKMVVKQSPEALFNAITNVRGWWSEEITGGSSKKGDEFFYRFKDVHNCRVRISEVVPNKRVVWHVLENYFSFTQDKTEWVDNDVVFEINQKGEETELTFTHVGLIPSVECYEVCSVAWTHYIFESLFKLVTEGKGVPNPREGGFNQELAELKNIPGR